MSLAYVDTSCLVAIVFGEPGWREVRDALASRRCLLASNLLEAELRSALAREGMGAGLGAALSWITWVHPDRTLAGEMKRVLRAGYLRGADLWHVACALFVAEDPAALSFATLDRRQAEVARQVGFPVLGGGSAPGPR